MLNSQKRSQKLIIIIDTYFGTFFLKITSNICFSKKKLIVSAQQRIVIYIAYVYIILLQPAYGSLGSGGWEKLTWFYWFANCVPEPSLHCCD